MTSTSALVVAAPASGSGKTTLAVGLARALARSGSTVQPFKAGPDFIDAGLLGRAADAPGFTLDAWMMGAKSVRSTFHARASDTRLAIVEGMMGLFDGAGPGSEGSTAHVAKLLGVPVVVVVDVSAMSSTAGAVARGMATHDAGVPVAGFVLNRVGSDKHARWAGRSIERATERPVFGALPADPELELPERHLGLHTADERHEDDPWFDRVADAVEAHLDIDRLLEATRYNGRHRMVARADRASVRARLGVARDAAFSFYYEANLRALRAAGAEIVPFSPLHDETLPDVDGLLLGGGYPEVHAHELAGNQRMRDAIADALEAGMPAQAECGGLLYLVDELEDQDGKTHSMCGVLDTEAIWSPRLTIGYVEGRVTSSTPLASRGETFRGHEFHRTELSGLPRDADLCYELDRGRGLGDGRDGWVVNNTVASYLHHHVARTPSWPQRFVSACGAHREERGGGGR